MNLQIAPWGCVTEILAILKKKWPDSKSSFYILKHTAEDRAHQTDKDQPLLLTPDGKVDPHGTFVIIFQGTFAAYFMESFNPDHSPLASALASCPSLAWDRNILTWGPIHERLYPVLDELRELLKCQKVSWTDTVSYHLSIEKAKATYVSIPDDVELGVLKEEHSKIVNDVWPHRRGEESRLWLASFIKLGRALGLFKKDSGKLVSWCFILPYGAPAIFQTSEEEKRKGYGEAVLRATTKRLGEAGIEPQAFIVQGNTISIKLFTKLNYKPGYSARWFDYINY